MMTSELRGVKVPVFKGEKASSFLDTAFPSHLLEVSVIQDPLM